MTMDNNKNKLFSKKLKELIRKQSWVIIVLILSQILTAFSGWTIVDPILQKTMPPEIKIDPYPYPQIHDGKQWIRVNIFNEGLSDIEPINIEYRLCGMDRFEKGKLHSNILKKERTDYFEVETNLNLNCSTRTEPVVIKFYKDSNDEYYFKFNESVSNICTYCEMEIRVFEGNNKIGELNYSYPFFEDELTLNISKYGGNIRAYEDAENTSELIHICDRKMFVFDPSTACLRGDYEREICEKYGYQPY